MPLMMHRILNQTLLAAMLTAPCALVLAADQTRSTNKTAGSEKMNDAYVVSDQNKAVAGKDGSASDSKRSGTLQPGADRDFVGKAALAGNAEIELSQLALQTSKNEKVRFYAEKMVKDHTAAARELKAIAAPRGVTPPGGLDAAHQKMLDQLAKMDNKVFDAAYMDQMIADHEQAVALFRRQAEHGKDGDLRAYAVKTLPHLQEHQQMARDIRQKL